MSRKWFQETVAELIGSVACPTGRQKIKSMLNNEEKKGKKKNNNNNKSKSSLNSKIFREIPIERKLRLTDLSELAKIFPESDKKVTFTMNIPKK